jgi:tRNA dimethylallyltransferase
LPPETAPLVALVGPTGAGKSELSLQIAEVFNAEIVNCDSVQVYKCLDIGSAKLPPERWRGIPHHLIDVVNPDEELTAGEYARIAREALRSIRSRGRMPVIVGGTGFYLRALLDGLSPAPARDPKLRDRLTELAKRKPAALHRFLRLYDQTAAARIHPNDSQKLIRAIELTVVAGRPASAVQAQPRRALHGYSVIKIGLAPERHLLRERIDTRCREMFQNGLLEETAALLSSGLPPNAKALQTLGYKQVVDVLTGRSSFGAAVAECQTKTRQYAKRQMTWFRADPEIHWLPGFGSDRAIQQAALDLLRDLLVCPLADNGVVAPA